jgi:UDP-N-acetylmuramate dehydrogenase
VDTYDKLQKTLGRARKNTPLASYTTFRIGGKAEYFFVARTTRDILRAAGWAHEQKLPCTVLGGGTNVLIADKGIKGLVVKVATGDVDISGRVVTAEAGANLFETIRRTLREGLGGMETMSGIPGTVGGAVYGNAGAYGHGIHEVVEEVVAFDGRKIRLLKNRDCKFTYRDSVFKKNHWVILAVRLKLKRAKRKELGRISREIVAIRAKKYKPGLRCAGSFFKNIELAKLTPAARKKILKMIDQNKIKGGKLPTGHLIELIGGRGMRVGGIGIPNFHGNLLVKLSRSGTAEDARRLAVIVKTKVKKKFGITLEEEVQFLGF